MIERPYLNRLRVVVWLGTIPFLLVTARLLWLQGIDQSDLQRRVELQSRAREYIPPPRGDILDRNGVRLAISVPDSSRTGEKRRLYPLGEAASQVVGYVNHEGKGEGGIEKQLHETLEGHPGWSTIRRGGTGQRSQSALWEGRPAKKGHNVTLTIDANLQDVAMSRLSEACKELKAKSGTVVGLDPQTGEVLVMASWPSFDPENYRNYGTAVRANKAVTMPYEPGSTFKLIPTVAALESKRFGMNTTIHCENGTYKLRGRTLTDHKELGLLPMHRCFAMSSNIAFAKIGERTQGLMYDVARRFGFVGATGIRLPGESGGRLKTPDRWRQDTPASVAMGYEVMCTPLQLAAAYGAVANDGVLMRPYVLKTIQNEAGAEVFRNQPEPLARVLDSKTCGQVRDLLREVVEQGTGAEAQLGWTTVGGKTGTTRKLVKTGTRPSGKPILNYSPDHHYASFVGMAPLENPRMVLLVLIDEPATKYGGAAAAPVFREILDAYRRIPGAKLHPEYPMVTVAKEPTRDRLKDFWATPALADGTLPPVSDQDDSYDFRGQSTRDALTWANDLDLEIEFRGSGRVVKQEIVGEGANQKFVLYCEPPTQTGLFVEEGTR